MQKALGEAAGPARWPALLAEARAGSQEALGRLLEELRPLLLQVAYDRLDPDLRAKGSGSDLVQQSYLEALRDFAGFRGGSPEELAGWLRHILQYNLLDFARHYRDTDKRALNREQVAGENRCGPDDRPAAPDPSPSEVVSFNEQVERVRRAVDRLSAEQRLAIRLRHEEGQPFAAIGRALGRSEEAARKVWARAIRELRLYLQDTYDDAAPGDRERPA